MDSETRQQNSSIAGLKVRRLIWDLESGELTLFCMKSDNDFASRLQAKEAGSLAEAGCSKFGYRWQITAFIGTKPADIDGEQLIAAAYKTQPKQSDLMLSVVLGNRYIPFEEDEVDILVFRSGEVPRQAAVLKLTAG